MIDEVGLCPKGLVAIFALERPRAFVNQSVPLKPSINNTSIEGEGGKTKLESFLPKNQHRYPREIIEF